MPTLNPEDSDNVDNDPDVPPLPSTYNGEEENDTDLTPLPPVDSSKEIKTSNSMIVTYCGSTLDLDSKGRKSFVGLG